MNCTEKIFILLRRSVTEDYRRTLRSQTWSPGGIPCKDKSAGWFQRAASVISWTHTKRKHSMITCRSHDGREPGGLSHEPGLWPLDLLTSEETLWPVCWWLSPHKSTNLTGTRAVVREILKWRFFLRFLSTVVWTGTSSRSSQSFSSSPTQNWDDCKYTFLIFPCLHPQLPLSLPLSISSDVLRDPSECTATVLCQNFYRGGGFKSLAVVTQCCSVLTWRGEKECTSPSVRPIFKRWKGAWSKCFAWTREEFLFRNSESFPELESRSYWWREDSHLLFSLYSLSLYTVFPSQLFYLSYPQRISASSG